MLAQPFEAGQSLFLSVSAMHTVEPLPGPPVVTITFRDLQKNCISGCTVCSLFSFSPSNYFKYWYYFFKVLSNVKDLPESATTPSVLVESPGKKRAITNRLCDALQVKVRAEERLCLGVVLYFISLICFILL